MHTLVLLWICQLPFNVLHLTRKASQDKRRVRVELWPTATWGSAQVMDGNYQDEQDRLWPISCPAMYSQIAILCPLKGTLGRLWLCVLFVLQGSSTWWLVAKEQQHVSQKHLEKSKETIGEESMNIWNLESRRSKVWGRDCVMDRRQGEHLTSEKVSDHFFF